VTGGYDKQVAIAIGAAEGAYPEQPAQQQLSVRLHRAPPPKSVRAAGDQSDSLWSCDAAAQVLTIPLLRQTARAATITVDF
jgi:hypothetical protein